MGGDPGTRPIVGGPWTEFLLPLTGPTRSKPAEGVYVGDGSSPVPVRLAGKIRRGEYVDMGELLPEFWTGTREEEGDGARARRSRKVTDILTWVQCFSSYVAVRGPTAPELIPELMAYLANIVRVSQDYTGLGWVRYDAAFRRQAALTGNTKWSVVNSTMYAMNFTGAAATKTRCELCLASSHTDRECAQRGNAEPDTRDRLKAIETAVLAMTRQPQPGQRPLLPAGPPRPSGEPCRKWNTTGCFFSRCRHSHTCSTCGGSHPATHCPQSGGPHGARPGPPPARHFHPPGRPY